MPCGIVSGLAPHLAKLAMRNFSQGGRQAPLPNAQPVLEGRRGGVCLLGTFADDVRSS